MNGSTRLFVVRHGQTAWNVERRIQGQLDLPLDDTGRWQAVRLAQALQGEALGAVYSSDLQRAHDTALPLAAATAAPLHTDVRLRERSFGRFEGHTYADIERQWPDEAARWRSREIGFGPGGGEPLQPFYDRCVDAVLALAASHPGQAIAIVAHGGVLDCLYRAAVGIDVAAPRGWQVGNATINRLLFNGERLQLVGWSDDGHLQGDALA
ncbi:MAG: histidine phosphatase family protein [Leptothrix sp. (in: Bacteria)]|nr:histidine phosphatase family protein [Leptothrix sp. (in: b-proteobacteria)]